jgi:drug/metabolite transporter (DMT)-like permease
VTAGSAAAATRRPPAALVWVALGIVYVVWGSTYLAIRVMVRDLPPLLSAGMRFLCAGALLGLVLRVRIGRGSLRITRRQLAGSAVLGLLLPAVGNGLVSIGEQEVPSGIAALLIAVVPLWVVVLRSLSGDRPRLATWIGVMVGFAGLALLVLPTAESGSIRVAGIALIVLAAVGWGTGSWLQPRLPLPRDPFVTAVYEMVVGGCILLLSGLLIGEIGDIDPEGVSAASVWAWLYLVVIGAGVAYTAYVWLLGHAPLSLIATYAYVNPVVAVFLGWLLLSEPITGAIVAGGAVIVAGVAIVVSAERPKLSGDVGAGEGCEVDVAPLPGDDAAPAEVR